MSEIFNKSTSEIPKLNEKKSEILNHYYSSLDKWLEVYNMIKYDTPPPEGYYERYYQECGFCDVHKSKDQHPCSKKCPISSSCFFMADVLWGLDRGNKKGAAYAVWQFTNLIHEIIRKEIARKC